MNYDKNGNDRTSNPLDALYEAVQTAADPLDRQEQDYSRRMGQEMVRTARELRPPEDTRHQSTGPAVVPLIDERLLNEGLNAGEEPWHPPKHFIERVLQNLGILIPGETFDQIYKASGTDKQTDASEIEQDRPIDYNLGYNLDTSIPGVMVDIRNNEPGQEASDAAFLAVAKLSCGAVLRTAYS